MTRLAEHVRHHYVAYVALAVALLGGGTAGAYATTLATKAKTKTLTACVNKNGGQMFLKSSTKAKCSRTQRKVNWSVTGPKGATGAAGAAGPAGPAGTPGSAGEITFLGGQLGASDVRPAGGVTALTNPSPGVFSITLNNPLCANPVVTPVDAGELPAGDGATAYISNIGPGPTFTVNTGGISSLGFTPIDLLFTVRADCPGS